MDNGMQVGRIVDEPLEKYHATDAIGSSKFRVFLRSPREYWIKYLSGLDGGDIATESLRFGRIAHSVIMESEKYDVIPSDINRRTKAGCEESDKLVATTPNLLNATKERH